MQELLVKRIEMTTTAHYQYVSGYSIEISKLKSVFLVHDKVNVDQFIWMVHRSDIRCVFACMRIANVYHILLRVRFVFDRYENIVRCSPQTHYKYCDHCFFPFCSFLLLKLHFHFIRGPRSTVHGPRAIHKIQCRTHTSAHKY